MSIEQFANNAETTLSAGMASTDTVLYVASATGFPSTPQFRIVIDSELIEVTVVSGTTWTITRGLEGTTASTHSAGAAVVQVLTAGVMTDIIAVVEGPQAANTVFAGPASGSPAPGEFRTLEAADLTAVALTVGATGISGGTSGRVLYDNSGVLGEYPVTGTGNVVLSNAPSLTGTIAESTTGIGTSVVPGLTLTNPTAATSGAPAQNSPALQWTGQGYATSSGSSQSVSFSIQVVPAQSVTYPDGTLTFTVRTPLGANFVLATLNNDSEFTVDLVNANFLNLGTQSVQQGWLTFLNASNNNEILVKASNSTAASFGLTLPANLPSANGYALVSDTSGNLSFAQLGVPQDVADWYVDVPTTDTSEGTLFSYTAPGNSLAADGYRLAAEYTIAYTYTASATREIRAYFGPSGSPTQIFDSTALTVTAAGLARLTIDVQRSGLNSARCDVWLDSPALTTADLIACVDVTGLDFTSDLVLVVTGQGSDAAGAITGKRGSVVLWEGAYTAPFFVSAASTTFNAGASSTFTVTADGDPQPTLSESGTFPTDITFNAATGVLSGTPSATDYAGSPYTLTFTAVNGISPNATQTFILTIYAAAPSFTSAASTTFAVGTAGSFTVTASGPPTPTLSESGTFPTDITFNAATGVLSGTPALGDAADSPYTLTFTAVNGISPNATQTFILTIYAAAPAFTSAASTTFYFGTAGTFTVTASGPPTPTFSESGTFPTDITFNAATGVLSGTPASGDVGTYTLSFTADNGIAPNATQSFLLSVDVPPPPALVAHSIMNADFSSTTPVDTTGADLIVVAVVGYTYVPTVSDNYGNTWTYIPASGATGGPNCLSALYYCVNPLVGSGHTFSASYNPSGFTIAMQAFSNAAGGLDGLQYAGSNTSGVSIQPGSVSPSVNHEVLVTCVASNTGSESSDTVDSGFIITDYFNADGTGGVGLVMAYLLQSTAAAIDLTWTYGSPGAIMSSAVAAFEPS